MQRTGEKYYIEAIHLRAVNCEKREDWFVAQKGVKIVISVLSDCICYDLQLSDCFAVIHL